jgi:hypothetical protein
MGPIKVQEILGLFRYDRCFLPIGDCVCHLCDDVFHLATSDDTNSGSGCAECPAFRVEVGVDFLSRQVIFN